VISPLEANNRVSVISVDMAYMNARYIDTLSQFLTKGELFQLQMELLYCLVDMMGATKNVDPEIVCDLIRDYFRKLNKEKANG
jgi:hypothetical protein